MDRAAIHREIGERMRPFSNGTEYYMWLESNCLTCRSYRPTATSSRHGCPIEVSVALAKWDDGTIPARIALRGGFVEPGPNGKLYERVDVAVIPKCPEYRGKDDPDDRPRRGPRPPANQLDMLDPRYESEPTRTATRS